MNTNTNNTKTLIINPGKTNTGSRFSKPVFVKIALSADGELTLSGVVGPLRSGDAESCGQIKSTLLELTHTKGWTEEMARKLHELWTKWHLNHMTAGSPAQEKFLTDNGISRDYVTARDALAAAGLLEDCDFWYGATERQVIPNGDQLSGFYKYAKLRSAHLAPAMKKYERIVAVDQKITALVNSITAGHTFIWGDVDDLCRKADAACGRFRVNRAGSTAGVLAILNAARPTHKQLTVPTFPSFHAFATERGWDWCNAHKLPFPMTTASPKPYTYGTAWLHTEVPVSVIDWLFSLPETTVQPAWI